MQTMFDKMFASLMLLKASLTDREEGATMVEYGLLVALIAVVVAVGATALGLGIDALFDEVVLEL
jgi:pilus assembly protein Flp/PilA